MMRVIQSEGAWSRVRLGLLYFHSSGLSLPRLAESIPITTVSIFLSWAHTDSHPENTCPLKIKIHLHALVKRKLHRIEKTFHFIIRFFLRSPAAVNYLTPRRSSRDVSQGSFPSWQAVSGRPRVTDFKGENCSCLQIAPFPQIAW